MLEMDIIIFIITSIIENIFVWVDKLFIFYCIASLDKTEWHCFSTPAPPSHYAKLKMVDFFLRNYSDKFIVSL